MVPNVATPGELPKAAKVIISQSDSTLTLVNASGKTIAQFPASIGSKHDPLPLGNWKVKSISVNPTFHFNPRLFWTQSRTQLRSQFRPARIIRLASCGSTFRKRIMEFMERRNRRVSARPVARLHPADKLGCNYGGTVGGRWRSRFVAKMNMARLL